MNQPRKSSCIDHVYINNPTAIKNLRGTIPPFGEHLLVPFYINYELGHPLETYYRNWQKYTKEALIGKLSVEN